MHLFLPLISMSEKIQKTTHEAAELAKREAWLALSPQERLIWHQQMLQRIYGPRYNAPLDLEARKIRIKREKGEHVD